MCVITYKPAGVKMPSKSILKKCFDKNPDGAGYMLPLNDKVVIRKGFMNFDAFYKDIKSTIAKNGIDSVKTPIVMHFRISTQGGIQAGLCHPYPICRDYKEMRKLENASDMALCHNGIISGCSESEYYGGYWDRKTKSWHRGEKARLDHNDTMKFIKDYASLVIDGDADFAKSKAKRELLERLCEYSKLAIMNGKGAVTLIGHFEKKDGIYYSNMLHFSDPSSKSYDFGGFKTAGSLAEQYLEEERSLGLMDDCKAGGCGTYEDDYPYDDDDDDDDIEYTSMRGCSFHPNGGWY